jgi:hypothetical protein
MWRAYVGRTIRELRVLYNPVTAESTGLRSFVNTNINEIAAMNPGLELYARVEDSDDPRVIARYDWGKTDTVRVANKTESEIEEIIDALVQKGWTMPRSPESEDYGARLRQPMAHGDGWKGVLEKHGVESS